MDAGVVAQSRSEAKQRMLELGLRGKPVSAPWGSVPHAEENPGIVVWRTAAQWESDPSAWNIGISVEAYIANGGR